MLLLFKKTVLGSLTCTFNKELNNPLEHLIKVKSQKKKKKPLDMVLVNNKNSDDYCSGWSVHHSFSYGMSVQLWYRELSQTFLTNDYYVPIKKKILFLLPLIQNITDFHLIPVGMNTHISPNTNHFTCHHLELSYQLLISSCTNSAISLWKPSSPPHSPFYLHHNVLQLSKILFVLSITVVSELFSIISKVSVKKKILRSH